MNWLNGVWKRLATILGVVTVIVSGTVGALSYFQTKAEASYQHEVIASYDERGKLETDLEVTKLEIKYLARLSDKGEISAEDEERLAYLRAKRDRIEARLAELNRQPGG